MRRREFGTFVGGAAVAWSLAANAQQNRTVPRMGVLWHAGSAEEEAVPLTAFVLGLHDLGYVDGRNIVLEHRFPAETPERFESFAAELVQLKVDILVASGQQSALALQRATTTMPIVFVAAYDPVGVGLVGNLARPSGNITGLSLPDLIGKRLEILKEAFPGLTRVAVLVNAAINPTYAHRYIEALQNDAARTLKLAVQPVEVNGPVDLERAFSAITREGFNGVAPAADLLFYNERRRIAALALERGLPTVFNNQEFVKSGGLLSYGANVPAVFRRAGVYVDKLIRGATPKDIPVEEPTKFQLFINLKTANALSLQMPPTLLTRADEVIE
jgi:putative tryptophan/tyrosine transport system substrate-binding protein